VRHTNQFASHLLRLADNKETAPKVDLIRDGDAILLGVAAKDFRGLAACIAGALYQLGVNLSQAHLFSATRCRLAFDFFHLVENQDLPPDLTARVREAVQQKLYIAEADAASLPPLRGEFELKGTEKGGYCLRHTTTSNASGLLYALTWKVYHHLGASIHGLSAQTSRGTTFVTVHLTLPYERSLEDAREIVRQHFRT
jgi:tRNA threonylcarbamoyladenosine modification (KEOPS) complex  Pcc1 subunit